MKKSKVQNPNRKQTSNPKFQTGVVTPDRGLEFEFWDLFGIWNLGFGIS
jgi:hypothetical protein